MFKAIVLLITDTLGLSGRLKLKSYALLGIYESVGYNVTSDPPETLRYDLQLFDVHLPRKIPRTSLNQLLVLSDQKTFSNLPLTLSNSKCFLRTGNLSI